MVFVVQTERKNSVLNLKKRFIGRYSAILIIEVLHFLEEADNCVSSGLY